MMDGSGVDAEDSVWSASNCEVRDEIEASVAVEFGGSSN